MRRELDLGIFETSIVELGGDDMLLALAMDAFREGNFEPKVLQAEEVTALLHAIHRVGQAVHTVSEAFYGPEAV